MPLIDVTAHAVERAQERRHFASLQRHELNRLIELEVALAVSAGRVSSTKPAWTKLVTRAEMHNGLSPKCVPLKPGEQFVWNAAETLGWIVKRESGRVVVLTSLHRVRAAEAVAA